jgi:PKD repeat protein/uncharacterized protein YraI
MNFWNQSSTLTKVVIVALLLAVVCACAGVSGFFFFNIFSSESQGPVIGGGDEGGSGSTGGIIIVIPTPAPGVPSVTATANLNIRSGPSTDYPKVGLLQEGQTAEASGVSPDGAWWVIKVPEAANGQGWVSGQFVTTANVENLPVVQPPPLPPATPAPPVVITEWQGEYFNNPNLSGQPALVRNDPEINFNWGTGSPAPEVTAGNFSVRWTISRELPAGTYSFSFWVSDGVRLWVDNNQLLNGWQQGPVRNYVVDVELAAGAHTVRVEYFQTSGPAVIQMELGYTAPPGEPQGPEAAINGTTQAVVGQTVNFNARNSSVAEGSHLTNFDWTFGDGAGASGVDVSHVYDTAGRYDVTLTVTDDKGLSDTAVQQIQIEGGEPPEPDEPPLAVINAPAQAEVGQSVAFDASASESANPIVSYEWNLGDGSTANAVTINHAYSTPGVYNVILTLTDDQGLQGTANHQIRIEEAPPEPSEPPTAVIDAPEQAAVGQEVTFDGAASQPGNGGAIIEYRWDFGDGTDPATGPTVTHIYPDPDEYTVVLTVTDESEQSGQARSNVVVEVDPDFGVDPNQEGGNSDGGEGQQEGQ